MYSETHRPQLLNDVVGHDKVKIRLQEYLTGTEFRRPVFLTGSPGIGKTTMALCSARTYGFDPLEINASKSLRSFEDVYKLQDSCRSTVNIMSLLQGNITKRTCVILDEIDGSDPHAQSKIIEWIKDPTRTVPLLFTGNDVPVIFKRNEKHLEIIRCFPPKNIINAEMTQALKECGYDVRRAMNMIQYGKSDIIPKYTVPATGLSIEKAFLHRQRMFELEDPLLNAHQIYTQDTECSFQTKL